MEKAWIPQASYAVRCSFNLCSLRQLQFQRQNWNEESGCMMGSNSEPVQESSEGSISISPLSRIPYELVLKEKCVMIGNNAGAIEVTVVSYAFFIYSQSLSVRQSFRIQSSSAWFAYRYPSKCAPSWNKELSTVHLPTPISVFLPTIDIYLYSGRWLTKMYYICCSFVNNSILIALLSELREIYGRNSLERSCFRGVFWWESSSWVFVDLPFKFCK